MRRILTTIVLVVVWFILTVLMAGLLNATMPVGAVEFAIIAAVVGVGVWGFHWLVERSKRVSA